MARVFIHGAMKGRYPLKAALSVIADKTIIAKPVAMVILSDLSIKLWKMTQASKKHDVVAKANLVLRDVWFVFLRLATCCRR